MRSLIAILIGTSLTLAVSTIALPLLWGGPGLDGPLSLSLIVACVCVVLGGLLASLLGEQRMLLHGTAVGLAVGGLIGLWAGAFPLKVLFFRVPIWRVASVPILSIAGLVGGWLAGRLISPGGLLAKE